MKRAICFFIFFIFFNFNINLFSSELYLYLNIEKPLSKAYHLHLNRIGFIDITDKKFSFKINQKFSSKQDFNQKFIKKINIGEGNYKNVEIITKSGRYNLPVSFKINKNEKKCLFIVWNIEASVNGKDFKPQIYIKKQEMPLRGEIIFVTSDTENVVFTLRADTNRVTYVIKIADNPKDISLSCSNDRIYIVSSDKKIVTVLEASTFRVIDTFLVPAVINPEILTLISTDRLIIVDSEYNRIVKMNSETGSLINNINIGDKLTDLIFNKSNNKLYVSSYNDRSILILDNDLNLYQKMKTEGAPSKLYINNNELFVSEYDTGFVEVFDLLTNQVKYRIKTDYPYEIVGLNDRIFISSYNDNKVGVLFKGQKSIYKNINLAGSPFKIRLYYKRGWLYVVLREMGKIAVIDVQKEEVIGYIDIGYKIYDSKIGRDGISESCF